jgi:transcriptional regulator with XRE-family HTH domain
LSIGPTMKEALKHRDMKQLELAFDTNYSRQTVAAWGNETRQIPEESNPKICEALDYPDYYLESWMHFTGGVGIPVLDGDYIDRHPAAMKDLVQRETNEALEHLEEACMIKPIHTRNAEDREEIKRVIQELLDAACSIINMVSVLCREYDFSMKQIYQSWIVTLKARRMRK